MRDISGKIHQGVNMKTSLRGWVGGLSVAMSAAVGMSPVAQAAPTFGNWDVTGGTISLTCQTGTTCTPLVTGDGFAQYEVTEGAAVYVMTIITDAGVTGAPGTLPYYDESYIQRGNQSGIMSHQSSSDAATNFASSTTIYTGWATAFTPTGANLEISQGFSSDGTALRGDGFSSSFSLAETINATSGAVEGKSMSIRQDAGLGDGVVNNDTDFQSFAIEYRSGTHVNTAGQLTLGADRADVNNTLAWAAADEVMVTWIGQSLDTGGTGGGSLFGYEGLTKNAGAASLSTFSTTNSDVEVDAADPTGYKAPFDWDTLFGSQLPTLIKPPQP